MYPHKDAAKVITIKVGNVLDILWKCGQTLSLFDTYFPFVDRKKYLDIPKIK